MNERETLFNQPMNRRGALRLFAAAGATAAGAGVLLKPMSTMAAGGPLVATIYLQIVDLPTADQTVIGELAPGDVVTNFDPMNPEIVGNLRHIADANGLSGWVVDAGLEPYDAPPEDPVFNIIRFVTVDEPLLVEPYGDVIADLVFGTQVETSTIRDGEFVYGRVWLTDGPVEGWVRNWLLTPDTASAYTVNLPGLEGAAPMLAEPREDADWVADVPHGAKVIDYDGVAVDGYRGVESAFGTGWISQEYLGVG